MATGFPRWALRLSLLAFLAAAFAAGRWSRSDAASVRCEPERPVVRRFEQADPSAPIWAPARRWLLPEIGSIFRDHFAVAESPMDGLEAVLVSPREEECQDDCPLALRVIGGPKGAVALRKILPSLRPDVRGLTRVPTLPLEVGRWIAKGVGALWAHEVEDRAGFIPLRALFITMPRPDLGTGVSTVGLSLSDGPDPYFDRLLTAAGDREGWQLLVSRIDSEDAAERLRTWGAVAVAHATGRASWRPIPDSATELGVAFGSLWGHFGGVPREVAGVYLDARGRLYVFGSDLAVRPIEGDEELRAAVVALLRRA